jgi:parallel beta-helix repeat protein
MPATMAAPGNNTAEGNWPPDIYQKVRLTVSNTTVRDGDTLNVTATAEGISHSWDTEGIENMNIVLYWGESEVMTFSPIFNQTGPNRGYLSGGTTTGLKSCGVTWVSTNWGGAPYPSPSTFKVSFRLGAQAAIGPYNEKLIPRVSAWFGIQTIPPSIATVYLNPEIIRIEADGSITPSDAPITRLGNNYTLQSDITKIIQVYRNNAIVNGANYNISYIQGLEAISIRANGVTIRNFKIYDCTYGIRQQLCDGALIENNDIHNTDFPIRLENSTSSTIRNNSIESASHGILIKDSTSNTVTANNSTKCVAAGIMLENSKGNLVNQNTLKDNILSGVFVGFSSGNQLIGNHVLNTEKKQGGIDLTESSSNLVSGNLIESAGAGVNMMYAEYNTIYGNIINNCTTGIDLLSKNEFNKISFNALNDNSPYGIQLSESNNNNIFSNTIKLTQNTDTLSIAMAFSNSTNNAIYSNTLSVYQIAFRISTGENNRVYNNKILCSPPIVVLENTLSLSWVSPYPTGGNYWSDYQGIDVYSGINQDVAGSDGIGDAPCLLQAFDSINGGQLGNRIYAFDPYPLTSEWNNSTITKVTINGQEEVITIITKTSILQVASTENVLNFTVSGPSGNKGYAHLICPKSNTTALRVYMDGASLDSKITSDETNYYIYFEFSLSTHQITLPFTEIIPENMVGIKFLFKSVARPSDFNPNVSDSRYLAVAFDYVEILDKDQNSLTKIDIGTEEARSSMRLGWSRNQLNWGTVSNYVWVEGTDKIATLVTQRYPNAEYLKIKITPLFQNNTMQAYYDNTLIGTVDPDIKWTEYTFNLPVTQNPLPTATPTPTPTATPSPTTSPSPSSSPTPTPPPTKVYATTNNGSVIELPITGTITSTQMSGITISTNQSTSSTIVAFTVTGTAGTSGFGNVTIPKSATAYGTTPTIYIDNQPASNQGYTYDADNYYVWYTTNFSTHQISIVFSPGTVIQEFQSAFIVLAIPIAMIPVILFGTKKRKRYKT